MEQAPRNVIVFGETGVGKSSLINLMLGEDKANTSSGASGCTFESTLYQGTIDGRVYNFHDTVGLGEHSTGTVDSTKAIGHLYKLVKRLADSGGVHLLVFVVKCGRVTETMQKNYALFFKGFCEEKLPVVIAVTCCENDEPMEGWWVVNGEAFAKAGMTFAGHACVCASKGRWNERLQCHANEDLIRESKVAMKNLIIEHCKEQGWEKPKISWITGILGWIIDLFSGKIPAVYKALYNSLLGSFTEAEAESIIEQVKISE